LPLLLASHGLFYIAGPGGSCAPFAFRHNHDTQGYDNEADDAEKDTRKKPLIGLTDRK
jgi:hypothetical protein